MGLSAFGQARWLGAPRIEESPANETLGSVPWALVDARFRLKGSVSAQRGPGIAPRPKGAPSKGWVASQSCCKFTPAQVPGGVQFMRRSPPRGFLGVAGSLPSYLIRLSRWRSSWVNLTPLVACVM